MAVTARAGVRADCDALSATKAARIPPACTRLPTGIESRAKTLRFTEFPFKPMFVTNLVPVHSMRMQHPRGRRFSSQPQLDRGRPGTGSFCVQAREGAVITVTGAVRFRSAVCGVGQGVRMGRASQEVPTYGLLSSVAGLCARRELSPQRAPRKSAES